MKKSLIINADDFGLHELINKGIVNSFTQGCLTSTSLIASGIAAEHAMDLATQHKNLGVGVHLTLVGSLKPVLPLDKVRSLINTDGVFPATHVEFIKKYFAGNINLQEVYSELSMQVQIIKKRLLPTHLDSHQHLHILPKIFDIALMICQQENIRAIRIPAEPYTFSGNYPLTLGRIIGRTGLTFLSELARSKLQHNNIKTTEHFFGMLAGGNMNSNYLKNILKQLPQGRTEIMMHPGDSTTELSSIFPWHYSWADEKAALLAPDIKTILREKSIELINFGTLYDG